MNVGDTIITTNNGDGTGTKTVYDSFGNVTYAETIYELPVLDVPKDPDLSAPKGMRIKNDVY